MNESRLLTRALPMQEPPGQPALTLEERGAKEGVGELVTIVSNHVPIYRLLIHLFKT